MISHASMKVIMLAAVTTRAMDAASRLKKK